MINPIENDSSSQSSIEHESRHSAFHLTYVRQICLAAITLFPFVGFLLLKIDPGCTERLSHRFIISGYFTILFVLTYYSKWFQKHADEVARVGLCLGIVWTVWITYVNNFDIHFSIAMVAGIGALIIIFQSRFWSVIFILGIVIVIGIAYYLRSPTSEFSLSIFLNIIVLGTIALVVNTYNLKLDAEVQRLNQKFQEQNQNLEELVNERTKLLKSKNEELESYAHIVSHDLKTPLRSIGAFTELIQHKLDAGQYEELGKYSEIVNKGVSSMTDIINSLLQHARVGKDEKNLGNVNVGAILNNLIATNFKSDLYKDVQISFLNELPKEIFCDAKQIELLFQNLISNALKYNKSPNRKVDISYKSIDQYHQFKIQDNGIGIEPRYQEQIFNMFARLHTKHEFEGTGIGLAICKRIVENHKGKIWIDPDFTDGSMFCFTIEKFPESA